MSEASVTLPVEIFFNRRRWRQLRWFLTAVFFVSGVISGMIGGRTWIASTGMAACLAAAGSVAFWLMAWRDERLSYLISGEGVSVRRAGREMEWVPVEAIAAVRAWPLEVRLSSGRKIKFSLIREEMLEARVALSHSLAAAGRRDLIPDFP